ncbi:hypothetical protein Tco_1516753 [Tanacetum coccineum]
MSKGISLTFSIRTRHTNKKLAQIRLHHHHNTHNRRRHSNNIPVLVPNILRPYRHRNIFSVNNNKRFLTTNSTTNFKISNNKKNVPFQNLQKQPDDFQQSQPQPPKDKRKKREAKRATVDLVDENNEEEEPIRQCARWSREEEILLTECWIETSENGQIGADRSEDYSIWGQIWMTKHMYQAENPRRKLQAGTSAYEAKKEKEVAMMKFKEMEFLTIDTDLLLKLKASIIRKRQEKIIANMHSNMTNDNNLIFFM